MRLNKQNIAQLGLNNTSLVLFVVVFIVFGLMSSQFLSFQSLENIIKQSAFVGIVAVGMTFVLLTAGIDLSIGSIMYLATIIGILSMRDYGWSFPMGLLACLATGLIFGAINGLIITRLKIIPFVVTLGTMVAGRGLALLLSKSYTVPVPDDVRHAISGRMFGVIPTPIIVFALVVLIAYIFLNMTSLGREIYAIGNDEEAARKAGINRNRVLTTVYMVSGLLAALGGFISVAQQGVINPGFGEGAEFNVISATVLGGTSLFGGVGSVFPGTVIGTILIQMIQTGLVSAQIDIYFQPIITAAILLVAVFLDSLRTMQLTKLRRRFIRVDEPARAG